MRIATRLTLLLCMLLLATPPARAAQRLSGELDRARTDARWSRIYLADSAAAIERAGPVVRHARAGGSALDVPPNAPDVAVKPAANRTQTEISCAIHPTNPSVILVGTNTTDFPVSQVFGTGVYWSLNGGQTWAGTDNPGGVANRGDPAAVIGPDGRFMIGFISADRGMGVAFSTDQGATWTQRSVSAIAGLDKNHLAADNATGSPFLGNYYNAWVNLATAGANVNDIEFSRSNDGGLTWSSVRNVSNNVFAGSHNQGCNIQVGPGGEVYVCWSVYDAFPADETAIGFNKSLDGGVTWAGETRKITGIRGQRNTPLPNTTIRRNSFPSMAVDVSTGPRRGTVYIVWTNVGVPGVNTGTDASIWIVKSTDGGAAFSAPTRVNDDAGTNSQWFPWISCDPVTGRLAVIFYDRRDDPANSLTRVYMATSDDGGVTWENFPVSDVSFTPAPIPGLAAGYMGDYLGIAVNGNRAFPGWADNRSGNFLCYVSPTLLLDPDDPNPPTAVSSFSDFSTPNSALLQWTDPTTFTDGTPLAGFSMDVLRDGILVANVDQGLGTYTDGGLTDGQSYAYAFRTRMDATDSLSTLVETSVFAGGAPTPGAPRLVASQGGANSATLSWVNPSIQADGTRLDDFAGVRIYRNGAFLVELVRAASDTGTTDQYVDNPTPGSFYSYELSALDSETPVHESARVSAPGIFIGPTPAFLVWQAAASAASSADSIVAALAARGEAAVKVNNLFQFSADLNAHQMVFACAGVFPGQHVITGAEGAALDDFVQDGGRLYLEGGDAFNDPGVGGYDLRPIFGLAPGSTGTADLFNVTGQGELASFQFTYAGPNNRMDDLVPVASAPVFRNSTTQDNVAVFRAPYVLGRAIGAAFEFGGLRSTVHTQADLMASYLRLFRVNGDPNPVTQLTAFSDHLTPTSARLTWTDPTTFVYGPPLVDFSVDVMRDGILVANVDQGVGTHLDAGLTDGHSYTYILRVRDDQTDSLSVPVAATVFAGGSPTPAAPANVSATGSVTSATIGWTNPALQTDGTRLDDFAGIRIHRNGSLLIQLARTPADTGRADSYVDAAPPGAFYTYEVAAFDSETPIHESARVAAPRCFVGPVPSILVWQARNVPASSADSILAALAALGESAVKLDSLLFFSSDLNVHQIVFACAGVFPNNHVLTTAEGAALNNFVLDGGRLYLEGGDCFNFDPGIGGYDVRPIFGLGPGANGTADLAALTGLNDLAGLPFTYAGPNNRIDDLVPAQSTTVFRNTATQDVVTVFRNGYGLGRGIGAAYEFGGLRSPTIPRSALLARYLGFFRSTGAPVMVLGADSLTATVQQTRSATLAFSVGNPGTANAPLNLALAEASDTPWLSIAPAVATVPANGSTSITLTVSAGALPPGPVTTRVVVSSDAPATPRDTVQVTMNVAGIPALSVTPVIELVEVPVGGTVNDSITIANSGFGTLNYSLAIIGVGGDDSEEFTETIQAVTTESAWVGNIYDVGTGFPLTSVEQRLNLPAATELEFFVYESTGPQSWIKIASTTVTAGPGLAWYSSGPIAALLRPGMRYFIGCAHLGTATAYRDDGTNAPDNTRFGTLSRSSQGFTYPPPPTGTFGESGFIWAQILRYGVPVDVDILSPLTGTLSQGQSSVVALRIRNGDVGLYRAVLNVFHDAPFAGPVALPIVIGVGVPPTDVPADGAGSPTVSALLPAEPNPSRGETRIRYTLAAPARVRLAVHDIAGRLIRTLREGPHGPGAFFATWDGRNAAGAPAPAGVYFYTFEAGARSERRKLVLLR